MTACAAAYWAPVLGLVGTGLDYNTDVQVPSSMLKHSYTVLLYNFFNIPTT